MEPYEGPCQIYFVNVELGHAQDGTPVIRAENGVFVTYQFRRGLYVGREQIKVTGPR